jgi:hypothetical protein
VIDLQLNRRVVECHAGRLADGGGATKGDGVLRRRRAFHARAIEATVVAAEEAGR